MKFKLATIASHSATAFAVLVIGILLSAAATHIVATRVDNANRARFDNAVSDAQRVIEARVQAYAEVLVGLRGLMTHGKFPTRGEFTAYVESLDLHHRYPGIRAINYAQRIPAHEKAAFEAMMRASAATDSGAYRDFKIKPEGERPEYVVVRYVEPLEENEAALGLDLGGDPVRLDALTRARDTGRIVTTGVIALALDPSKYPGFSMRLAIYRRGAPLSSEAARREALTGVVSAAFIVIDLMKGALSESFLGNIHVSIHDVGNAEAAGAVAQASARELMFDSNRLLPASLVPQTAGAIEAAPLTKKTGMEVGGRRWELGFSARPEFDASSGRWLPLGTFLGGLTISLLMFALIRLLATSGSRAIRMADRITGTLRNNQSALRESEARLRSLTTMSSDFYWQSDAEHRLLARGQDDQRMVVEAFANDAQVGLHRWDIPHVAPDEAGWQAHRAVLDAHQPFRDFEVARYGRDGVVRHILLSGDPLFDAGGTFLGYRGVGKDITARVRAEAALQESEVRYRTLIEWSYEAIIVHRDGKILYLNPAAVGMFGAASAADLLGTAMPDRVHPDFHVFGQGRRNAIANLGISVPMVEMKYVKVDGSVIDVEDQATLILFDGEPAVLTAARDITDRKAAQVMIEESRQLLLTIIDTAPARIFWKDRESRYLGCNVAFAMDKGLAHPREVIGKDDSQMGRREGSGKYRADDLAVMNTGVAKLAYEEPLTTSEGKTIWLRISKVPLRNQYMDIIGVMGMYEDITDYKRAEEAREEATNRLQKIASRLPGVVYQYRMRPDGSSCFPFASEAIRDIYRVSPEQVREDASAVFDVLHPDDRDGIVASIQQSAKELSPWRYEYRVKFDDGTVNWLFGNALPQQEADGAILWHGFITDITERKLAQEMQARLAAIVENSNDAIFSRSLEGRILSWNAGAEKMLGFTAAEMIGRTIPTSLPPGTESRFATNNALLLRGEVIAYESRRMSKDGRMVDVFSSHSPIKDAAGNIVGASIILQDMAERKQVEATRLSLEAQLRESQKMQAIGTLAGGIAHDFNNIIAAILGNTELARQDVSANTLAMESLGEIRKAGARARELVRQILSFSRRESATHKRIALAMVVQESVLLLRATLPARIALSVRCEGGVPDVLGDATQIEQVLINLGTNAMQALGGNPGRIYLNLDVVTQDMARDIGHLALNSLLGKHTEGLLRLVVGDDGPGMDAPTLERIFEPFFTTKAVNEGTGLGLAVVHGIIQAHGGAIIAESEPGNGATFTIYLPPAAPGQTGAETAKPGEAAIEPQALPLPLGQRILYLDDDEALVHLVRRLLERQGLHVHGYTDQDEALAALRADPSVFDLVLSDYNMPGMSGLDVAREVRAIRADLPVAIASGYIDDVLRAGAGEAGVRGLIFKADAVDEFCTLVRRLAQSVGEMGKA